MKLSDSQLMLLEQLTYADENLFEKLDIPNFKPKNKLRNLGKISYEKINSLKGKKLKIVLCLGMSGQIFFVLSKVIRIL